MPFPWSKKVARVIPETVPTYSVDTEVVEQIVLPEIPSTEVIQIVDIPTVDDKISVEEHKNGEQVVDARKEDDEDDEVQGDLQEGGWVEEGDHGGEEELEEARGS